jgi:hypothetical protein
MKVFRCAHITEQPNRGVPPKLVADVVGHSEPRSLSKYAGINLEPSKRHFDAAKKQHPILRRRKITPRLMRHSGACALLQSGVDLATVRHPANRLVADELESRWNAALVRVREIEQRIAVATGRTARRDRSRRAAPTCR